MKLTDLPPLPSMPILEETPDEIYQRFVNRAIADARAKGKPPPPTEEGGDFHTLWYPLAQEFAEQQELWTYGFIQAFPIWADGEFLEAHGWTDGLRKKEGEDDDTFRLRLLDRAFIEEGSGRRKDYEAWAKEVQGVGEAIAVEKERHDNSIDLYLTDMNGQPVTPEFAAQVKAAMWEDKRIAGHDLETHPAPVFVLRVEATIQTAGDRIALAEQIKKRIIDYAKDRTKLIYNYVAALLLIDIGEDYSNFTMNGSTSDVIIPPISVLQVEVILS
ncbi:baseplate J/gp47 family protein [Aneurinibacillus sp. BA2021]|nr:baseplate J/gp47 family protein [Aneurinibacillus sp. BA2021]